MLQLTLGVRPIRIVAITLVLLFSAIAASWAATSEEEICDLSADYVLGLENYPVAIALHRKFLRAHIDNALAHYHLGFAQGMMGDRMAEVREYQRAEALGLRSLDLFLNLGLAQLENGELEAATDSLRRAVLLGWDHSESHFNLARVNERRGMLADAEHETLASLQLNPAQPDARNMLGVIYAREGKTVRASLVWCELMRDDPEYQPARANLEILGSQSAVALGGRCALPGGRRQSHQR